MNPGDVELRLIDPKKNKFRVYALTECRTLFGEICLRIVWGRLGHRTKRERSETFRDEHELARRRAELLARRRSHGYTPVASAAVEKRSPPATTPAAPRTPTPRRSSPARAPRVPRADRAIEHAIVEAHGMPLADPVVEDLVTRWHAATRAIATYLEERRPEVLDLVDVSTLASMYAQAAGLA